MTIYQNIRGALQNQLAEVVSIPTIVHESEDYSPTPGVPFVTCTLIPGSIRPITMGAIFYEHEGMFVITVVFPRKRKDLPGGTGPAEALADSIRHAFRVEEILTLSGSIVRIRYAERQMALIEADWIRIPVTVAWFTHDSD